MSQTINIAKIRADAEALFNQGAFLCSEAIVASIRENMAPDMPEAMIATASGFPGGVGRSKCICGAVSGAVLCLGYFFGRTEAADPKIQRCLALADELQESFRTNHKGVLCCHIHTAGLDMAKGEHRPQCAAFTGEMAAKTAEILARELNLPLEP